MIADQVLRDHRRIDILVNNGGISQRALTVETDLEVDRRIMEVNYFGQVALTKAVLPFMLQQKDGHLVVLSSLTGKFGFPLRSAYAASKHALHGFFETLWLENRDHGLRVTLVNPGRIRTQVSVNALTKDGTPSGEMDPGQAKGMSAKKCAHQILTAVHRNQFELTIGSLGEQFMVWLKRHFPGLFHALVRKVAAK
jgi:short-subunit dehydrogenase